MGRPITTTAVSRQYFISRGALVSIMEHRAGRRRRATTPAHFDHAGRGNDSTRKKLVPEACFFALTQTLGARLRSCGEGVQGFNREMTQCCQ